MHLLRLLFSISLIILLCAPCESFLKIGKKREELHRNSMNVAKQIRFQLYDELEKMARGVSNVKRVLRNAYALVDVQNSVTRTLDKHQPKFEEDSKYE